MAIRSVLTVWLRKINRCELYSVRRARSKKRKGIEIMPLITYINTHLLTSSRVVKDECFHDMSDIVLHDEVNPFFLVHVVEPLDVR